MESLRGCLTSPRGEQRQMVILLSCSGLALSGPWLFFFLSILMNKTKQNKGKLLYIFAKIDKLCFMFYKLYPWFNVL